MNEEFGNDDAFLAGVRSALESDAGVDAAQLEVIRQAAEREVRVRGTAGRRIWTSAVFKVAASLLVLAGFAGLFVRQDPESAGASLTLQTIALLEEVDETEFSAAAPESLSAVEQVLAWQDAPYYEAVATDENFGDNTEILF